MNWTVILHQQLRSGNARLCIDLLQQHSIVYLSIIIRIAALCLLSANHPRSLSTTLLLGLGENTISSAGNRLLQQIDVVCYFSSPYSFSAYNSIITIHIQRSKGIKRKNISHIVVVATYSKIMFASTFRSIVYNYTSIRYRNVTDAIQAIQTEDCDLSAEIFWLL